jgi:DNA-binding transcriptional regulator YhcF (GntR family)
VDGKWGLMSRDPDGRGYRTSVRDVERFILSRLAAGSFAVGGRLPTCGQLGAELGANKNTVSKSYQALMRRGYLVAYPGRGTFVLRRPKDEDRREAVREIEALLRSAIEQADLSGLSLDEFSTITKEMAYRYFNRVKLRVGYVEGTRDDARHLGRQLQAAVSTPIEPITVDQITKNPEAIAARFDILAVNLSYLGTVERRLRRVKDVSRAEIVPILSLPDPATLVQVARLAPGTRLAIIVETEDTIPSLVGLVKSFNPALNTDAKLTSSPTLAETLDWAEVMMITPEAETRLRRLNRQIETIEVGFKLDEVSVAELGQRIASLTKTNLDVPISAFTPDPRTSKVRTGDRSEAGR